MFPFVVLAYNSVNFGLMHYSLFPQMGIMFKIQGQAENFELVLQ